MKFLYGLLTLVVLTILLVLFSNIKQAKGNADQAKIDICQWNVFVNYQKELAERCGRHHLGATCQLSESESQQFNWEQNYEEPTIACEHL